MLKLQIQVVLLVALLNGSATAQETEQVAQQASFGSMQISVGDSRVISRTIVMEARSGNRRERAQTEYRARVEILGMAQDRIQSAKIDIEKLETQGSAAAFPALAGKTYQVNLSSAGVPEYLNDKGEVAAIVEQQVLQVLATVLWKVDLGQALFAGKRLSVGSEFFVFKASEHAGQELQIANRLASKFFSPELSNAPLREMKLSLQAIYDGIAEVRCLMQISAPSPTDAEAVVHAAGNLWIRIADSQVLNAQLAMSKNTNVFGQATVQQVFTYRETFQHFASTKTIVVPKLNDSLNKQVKAIFHMESNAMSKEMLADLTIELDPGSANWTGKAEACTVSVDGVASDRFSGKDFSLSSSGRTVNVHELDAPLNMYESHILGFAGVSVASVDPLSLIPANRVLAVGESVDLTSGDPVLSRFIKLGRNREMALERADLTLLSVDVVDGRRLATFELYVGRYRNPEHASSNRVSGRIAMDLDLGVTTSRELLFTETSVMELESDRRFIREQYQTSFPWQTADPELFLRAATQGNLETLQAQLVAGIDLNLVNEFHDTAISRAARSGHEHLVTWLLKNGAKVHPTPEADSPLHLACLLGHLEIVRILQAAGANLDLADSRNGSTALHNAAGTGQLEIVQLLLESGATPGLLDGAGRTALDASSGRHLEIANLLRAKRGMQPEVAITDAQKASLMAAAAAGDVEGVKGIVAGGVRTDEKDAEGRNIVMLAIINDQSAAAMAFIAMGSGLDTRDAKGRRAISYAVEKGMLTVVDRLIEAGSKLSSKDAKTAIASGRFEIFKRMVEAGLEINDNQGGSRYFAIAASSGNVELARTLIEMGAETGYSRREGYPLENAVINGHVEMTRFLIDGGADLQWKTKNVFRGANLLHTAAYWGGGQAVTALLLENAVDPSVSHDLIIIEGTPLHIAAYRGNSGVIEALAEAGIRLDEPSVDGMLPLDLAVKDPENVAAVKALIAAGANLNVAGPGAKWTPIMTAIKQHAPQNLLALIEGGADMYVETGDQSLLDSSFYERECISLKVMLDADIDIVRSMIYPGAAVLAAISAKNQLAIRLLAEHGARLDGREADDSTPLHRAMQLENEGLLKAVLDAGGNRGALNADGESAREYGVRLKRESLVAILDASPPVHDMGDLAESIQFATGRAWSKRTSKSIFKYEFVTTIVDGEDNWFAVHHQDEYLTLDDHFLEDGSVNIAVREARVTGFTGSEEVNQSLPETFLRVLSGDGGYLVARADGKNLSDQERKFLDSFQVRGEPQPLLSYLSDKSIEVGELVRFPSRTARIINPSQILPYSRIIGILESILPVGPERPVAAGVFQITMRQWSKDDAEVDSTTLLTGTLTIRSDGWLEAVNIAGPAQLLHEREGLKYKGQGTFTVEKTFEHQ